MPIDEQKLKAILAEHDKDFKRQVAQLQEDFKHQVGVQGDDFKRHVGVLIEETDRKVDLVQEGFQGVAESLDEHREEVASIRKVIEEMRIHLFRKADLDRLEALEKRVDTLEKRYLER